jgi:hypothetical protein
MIAEPLARRTAERQAEKLLLDEMQLQATETEQTWVYAFVPKGRVRGGGFQLTVSKETGQVIDVLHFQ